MSRPADTERVPLAFLETFCADRDAGTERSLAEYLQLYPDHQETVAEEYLRARSEDQPDASTASVAEVISSDDRTLGPYHLIEELGRGGHSTVFLSEDTRLGRRVALKVLTGLGPVAERELARFRREADVASRIEHPGICAVHDAGLVGGVQCPVGPLEEPQQARKLLAGEGAALPRRARGGISDGFLLRSALLRPRPQVHDRNRGVLGGQAPRDAVCKGLPWM
jgi:hypothetical protein